MTEPIPTDADIDRALREAAIAPASASTDAGSVSNHSLRDLIDLHRYLANVHAARSSRGGIRVQRLIPPGTA